MELTEKVDLLTNAWIKWKNISLHFVAFTLSKIVFKTKRLKNLLFTLIFPLKKFKELCIKLLCNKNFNIHFYGIYKKTEPWNYSTFSVIL